MTRPIAPGDVVTWPAISCGQNTQRVGRVVAIIPAGDNAVAAVPAGTPSRHRKIRHTVAKDARALVAVETAGSPIPYYYAPQISRIRLADTPDPPRYCRHCGKPVPESRKSHYCSNDCAAKADRQRRHNEIMAKYAGSANMRAIADRAYIATEIHHTTYGKDVAKDYK